MERPKVTAKPIERTVIGEVVYLDEMRRAGHYPEPYERLSDMAIQLYEESAALYASHGVRPEIMDEYDQYDAQRTDLQCSCGEFAEILLKLKAPNSRLSFVDIVVEQNAEEILRRLKDMRVGSLLAPDDEQLALESDGSYYPVLDVKKRDAQLLGVGLTVYGWSDQKYHIIDGETPERRVLQYPESERMSWYEFALSFSYRHPKAGLLVEKITLSVGLQPGSVHLHSSVWMSAYAETGYEGHGGKGLPDETEEDVVAFADLIAEIVGDEPISSEQYQRKQMEQYLEKLYISDSTKYIREWIANSRPSHVMYDLQNTVLEDGEVSLARALCDPAVADQAHRQLVLLIDKMRTIRNISAADKDKQELFGKLKPWRDTFKR